MALTLATKMDLRDEVEYVVVFCGCSLGFVDKGGGSRKRVVGFSDEVGVGECFST